MLRRAVAPKVGIVRWVLGVLAALALLPSAGSAQVTFTVAATGGTHTSIQDAVNACPPAGCVISLADTVYPLPREIWLETKTNLTIQASAALKAAGKKPRLYYAGAIPEFEQPGTAVNPTDPDRPKLWKKWPNQGTSKTVVGAGGNTTNKYSTSGFQHNGYIVAYKSTNITIDGIYIDGKKPTTFINTGIWSDKYDVFFGNVGINLFQSKNVAVRNTEVANCFAAFYFQNRNVGGAFAMPNPNDIDVSSIVPYSRFGQVGKHLIEKNYVHNNWYGFYDEMEWDLGSTIRYNIFNNNYNTQYAQNKDSLAETNNMSGGLMYEKDNSIAPHKIYNNTINGSSIVFGLSYFKSGVQHYFYNNLLTGWNRQGLNGKQMDADRQMIKRWKYFIYNNTFEIQTDSAFQTQKMSQGQVVDATLPDPNNAANTCAAGCWITWDTPVNVYTGLQMNQALWSGWEVGQGGKYIGTYKAQQYAITNNQVFDVFGVNAAGVITKMQGLGTAATDVTAQKNYWSRKVPYLSTVAGNAKFFEPDWTSPLVDTTILDAGWDAAGTRDGDGTIPDRGAVPSAKGALVSALNLVDQSIVQLDLTNKKVSFQYCLDGAAGAWTDLKFTTNIYFSRVAAAFTHADGSSDSYSKVDWSTPVTLTPTSAAPTMNSCGTYTANLPVIPTDSLARFDLIAEGKLNGTTVKSNPGVWVWRKALYRLDTWFTNSKGVTVDTARVGDTLQMHVVGKRNDNGTSIALDVLVGTPDAPVYQVGKGIMVAGDTLGRSIPAAGASYPVYFTKTGTVSITMSGLAGTLPVPGVAQISIRPGVPDHIVWQNPPTYSLLDHSKTLDQVATTFPQSPSPVQLLVVDAYGNAVDMSATVSLSAIQKNPLFPVADIKFGAAASGPFNSATTATPLSFVVPAASNGLLNFYDFTIGQEGVIFIGLANVVGKTAIDTGVFRIGKQLEKLYWTPVTPIDTFVTVRQRVHLILSEDGKTAKATSTYAKDTVTLRSAFGTSFFASATSTTPIDRIALAAGEADVWVTSTMPVKNDTLFASNFLLGLGLPEVYTPVSFRMPPTPPAPALSGASFADFNCDGYADSVTITLGSKLTAAVKLDSIHVAYGTTDLWIKTGWRILPDGLSVRLARPAGTVVRGSLSGSVGFAYTVSRPPVPDTSYATAAIAILDMVGPALVDTAYLVENFNRPTQNDTLKIKLTEAVNLTGSGWHFITVTSVGTPVAPGALAIKSATVNTVDPTRWTIVFEGNTLGASIAQGNRIRLAPTASVSDLAGNAPAGSECSPGVPVVEVPSPIPVLRTWLKDANGDGAADRLYIQFAKPTARSIKATDMPGSVRLTWAGAFDTASATSGFLIGNADSTLWELPIGPMTKGATVGGNNGNGLVEFAGGGRVGESRSVEDSVSPILTRASLSFGTGIDTLVITSSEPLKVAVGSNWVVKKTPAGSSPTGVSGVPFADASKTVWKIPMDPTSAGLVSVGDSVRLPGAASQFVADNSGTTPSSAEAQPWVVVVGADRAPSAAWYLDLNADGIVDAAGLEFAASLKTSPSFVFQLGGETSLRIDSTNGLVIAPDRKSATVTFVGTPFKTIKTDITPATDFGTMTSTMSDMSVSARFSIRDSVDPVILTALLTYASYSDAAHRNDTLKLKLSEPVNLSDAVNAKNVAWGVSPARPSELIHIQPGVEQIAPDMILVMFDTSKAYTQLYNGDSVRIAPIDAGGEMTDKSGNAPTLALAKWTRIQAAQRPPRFDVGIFPKPVMVIDPVLNPDNPILSQGPQITVWVGSNGMDENSGKFYPIKGSAVEGTSGIDRNSVIGNAIGPKFTVNGPFDATAIIYDNIGTYVGQTTIKVDTNMISSDVVKLDSTGKPVVGKFAGKDGSFEIVILWNGKNEAGKYVGSGVYMFRVVVYQDRVNLEGRKSHVMVMNQVTKVGVKSKTK